MGKEKTYINISPWVIIKIISVLVLFYLLFIIKDILAVFFVALILASAFDPWVDWMQTKKIPRSLGIIFIYLVIFILVGGLFSIIVPILIQQSADLSSSFPQIVDRVVSLFSTVKQYSIQHGFFNNINNYFSTVSSNLPSAAGGIFSTVTNIFGSIFSFFLILVITFYMTVEENAVKKLVVSLAPKSHQIYIMQLIGRMQKKVGLWLRGQMIMSLTIIVFTYIGLTILGVKYALILSLIAGLTEFVPYVGPIIASIPAVFLAFTQSPLLALFVAVLYYVIQLVESNIVYPKLMQKVVGLNPIISIAVVMIGYKVAGIIGVVLSIPVTTAVMVYLSDVFDNKIPKAGAEAGE